MHYDIYRVSTSNETSPTEFGANVNNNEDNSQNKGVDWNVQ